MSTINFYGKTAVVDSPVISSPLTGDFNSDVKEICLTNNFESNGFSAQSKNKNDEFKIIIYPKGVKVKSGTYSLSCLLAKLCELSNITSAMFITDDYLICIEDGLPLFEFHSTDFSQLKSRAESNYENLFSKPCLVFGDSKIFGEAESFEETFNAKIDEFSSAIFVKDNLVKRHVTSPVIPILIGVLVAAALAGWFVHHEVEKKRLAAIAAAQAAAAAEKASPKAVYEALETDWLAGKRDGCSPAEIKPHLKKFMLAAPFDLDGWKVSTLKVACKDTVTTGGEPVITVSASYLSAGKGRYASIFNHMRSINKDYKINFKFTLNEVVVLASAPIPASIYDKASAPLSDDFLINTGSKLQALSSVPIQTTLTEPVSINNSTELIDGVVIIKTIQTRMSGEARHWDAVFSRFPTLYIKKMDMNFGATALEKTNFNIEGYYVTK